MKIQEIEFSRLIPADYNPRVALTPDMPEFERLKNSIETFGNVEPIVWNERTGHIVGGHQRLAVLQHLGYTSAEVSVVDLDEKEEKLLNVALNKIKGQWDYSRLEEIFQEDELEEAKVTGFTGKSPSSSPRTTTSKTRQHGRTMRRTKKTKTRTSSEPRG